MRTDGWGRCSRHEDVSTMARKAKRKIDLDDSKYDALKRVLAAQGRNIDEELVAWFEDLYEDLVSGNAPVLQFPEGSFAVYGFKNQKETLYFISSKIMTLYRSAMCYKEREIFTEYLTIESAMYAVFGEDGVNVIQENLFDVLVKAMVNDERITVAAEYDLDGKFVKVYNRDGVTVRYYTLDTFMDAVETAETTLVRREGEREKTLERVLEGREFLTTPLPPIGYLAAQCMAYEAAVKVLRHDLDYADCKYADVLGDRLLDVKKGLKSFLDQTVMTDTEAIRPYLKECIDNCTDQLWADGYLKRYGWNYTAVNRAIIRAIEAPQMREFAESLFSEDLIEDAVEDVFDDRIESDIEDCIEDSIQDAEETHGMTM